MGKRRALDTPSPSPGPSKRQKRVHVWWDGCETDEEHAKAGYVHRHDPDDDYGNFPEGIKDMATGDMVILYGQAGIVREGLDPFIKTVDDAPIHEEEPEPEPPKKATRSKGKAAGGKAAGAASTASDKKGKGRAQPIVAEEEHVEINGEEYLNMDGWQFLEYKDLSKRNVKPILKQVERQVEYIKQLKKNWRTTNNKLEMPEDWFKEETIIVLASNRPWEMDKYDREEVSKTRISFFTEPISKRLKRIPFKTLARRHLSSRTSQQMQNDFCLRFRPSRPADKYAKKGEESPTNVELHPSLEKWIQHMNMPMGEHNVEINYAEFFTNLPRVWMVLTPKQRWPEEFHYPVSDQRIEFAMLKAPVRPTSKEDIEHMREQPISFGHPAVFLAQKGPKQWPETPAVRKWDQDWHFETEVWKKWLFPQKRQYCIENLAMSTQPSLDALVGTWFLRWQQQVTPQRRPNYNKLYPLWPPAEKRENVKEFLPDPTGEDEEPSPKPLNYSDLPVWAWIPGIIYDYNMCILVAHIPVLPEEPDEEHEPVSYVSYVIDEIEIKRPKSGDDDDSACLVERVRLGLAWQTLAKHAVQLTSLWDSVQLPEDLMRWEEIANYKEGPHGIPERPESKARKPNWPRGYDSDDDDDTPRYNRWSSREDQEKMRRMENADIDKLFDVDDEDEEVMMGIKNLRAGSVLSKSVEPKIRRWLECYEDDELAWMPFGEDNDEDAPVQYDSEVEYPPLEDEDEEELRKKFILWRAQ